MITYFLHWMHRFMNSLFCHIQCENNETADIFSVRNDVVLKTALNIHAWSVCYSAIASTIFATFPGSR